MRPADSVVEVRISPRAEEPLSLPLHSQLLTDLENENANNTSSTLGSPWSASKRPKTLEKLHKIVSLLLTGYSSEESRRKYKRAENWRHFHATLLKKLENIGIVSGLLLAANTNLLISGDLRRMTYVSVVASIALSLLSLVFGLLCLWSLIGVHPTRLKYLIRNNAALFYYLHATPSLFGGTAALAFFVAVGAWTWLDQSLDDYGWGGRILSILLSAALLGNAGSCFVLGASTSWHDKIYDDPPK